MPIWTMCCLSFSLCYRRVRHYWTPAHVLFVGYGLHVCRTETRSVTAKVIGFHTIGYRTKYQLVSKSMNPNSCAIFTINTTVAI